MSVIIKQGDSGSEAIICFGAKFKISVGLIQLVIESDNGFVIYLTCLWNSNEHKIPLEEHIYIFFLEMLLLNFITFKETRSATMNISRKFLFSF